MPLNFVHIRYAQWSDKQHGPDGPGDGTFGAIMRAPPELWRRAAIPIRTYRVRGHDDAFFLDSLSVPKVVEGLTAVADMPYRLCPRCVGQVGAEACGAWDFLKKQHRVYEPTYDWQAEEAQRQQQEEKARQEREAKAREREAAQARRRADEANASEQADWMGGRQSRPEWEQAEREHEEARKRAKAAREAEAAGRAQARGARFDQDWFFNRRSYTSGRSQQADQQAPQPGESFDDWVWRVTFGRDSAGPTSERGKRVYEQARRYSEQTKQQTYGRRVDPEPPRDEQREAFHREREARKKANEPPPTTSAPRMTRSRAFLVLGLAMSATAAEIKQAFRKRALECHPDRGGTHEQMAEVNAAYEYLK